MVLKIKGGNTNARRGVVNMVNFEYFKPIEKEPAMKAEDYEILRDCTLDTLIDDGKCFDAVKFYKKRIFDNMLNADGKLDYLFSYQHKYEIQPILEYLIENKYIEKKERKPEVGDVWRINDKNNYLIIEDQTGDYKTLNIKHNKITHMYIQDDCWTYLCKLKDMIKPPTQHKEIDPDRLEKYVKGTM